MRHLLVACLVLAVTATAATADKPKIAILGVQPNNTGDAVIARDITLTLRLRAKSGVGPFVIAPASDVELADAKATHKCADEAVACMAAAGAALGADYLMYGHVIRTPKGYTISLQLLDVRAKQPRQAVIDNLEKDKAANEAVVRTWARRAYEKLVGIEPTRKP